MLACHWSEGSGWRTVRDQPSGAPAPDRHFSCLPASEWTRWLVFLALARQVLVFEDLALFNPVSQCASGGEFCSLVDREAFVPVAVVVLVM